MRIRALSIAASLALLVASPAFAQGTDVYDPVTAPAGGSDEIAYPPLAPTNTWNVSATATVASGRAFADQGFILTDEPVTELDLTACRGPWCVDLWRAQSLVSDDSVHETDLTLAYTFEHAGTTYQVRIGGYEVPGPDVADFYVTATRPISDECGITASYEHMEGGFVDRVGKLKATCTDTFGDSQFGWEGSGAVAYSDWAGDASVGYQATLYYQFDNGVRLTTGVKGFVGAESGEVGYASISKSW